MTTKKVTLKEMIGASQVKKLEKACEDLLRKAFVASRNTKILPGAYITIKWIRTEMFSEEFFAAEFLAHYGLLDYSDRSGPGFRNFEIAPKGEKLFNRFVRKEGEAMGLVEKLKESTKRIKKQGRT